LKIFNELEQKFKDKPAGVNDGVVYGIVSVKNNIQWLEYYTEPNNIAAYKVFNLDDIMVRIGYMKEADFVLGYLKHLNNDGKLKTWTVYENKDDICLLVSLVN
jgi:hypothetical protein